MAFKMKVLHLYHDIMNLYGDYANLTALARFLGHNGGRVAIEYMTFGDRVDLLDYDFLYMGSGTERNQKLVLEDFRRYSDAFSAYVESGKPALFTGNSFEILGKSITSADGRVYDGLGLLGFTSVEQNARRITADVIYGAKFLSKPIVGFVNTCSELSGVEDAPFYVKMGIGNKGDKTEGVIKNDFIGTHVTGPIMVKNPHFLKYVAELITGRSDLSTDTLDYEKKAYNVTLTELKKRVEGK